MRNDDDFPIELFWLTLWSIGVFVLGYMFGGGGR